MVQIKLKGVIGVESPSPRSFWCGYHALQHTATHCDTLKHCNTLQRHGAGILVIAARLRCHGDGILVIAARLQEVSGAAINVFYQKSPAFHRKERYMPWKNKRKPYVFNPNSSTLHQKIIESRIPTDRTKNHKKPHAYRIKHYILSPTALFFYQKKPDFLSTRAIYSIKEILYSVKQSPIFRQ